MQWDPIFAGIAAARNGRLDAVRTVQDALGNYAGSPDWSQLTQALGHVIDRSPEGAAAVPLDDTDAILLRRCTDALEGIVRIPPELA
jgi:hypothetical protein